MREAPEPEPRTITPRRLCLRAAAYVWASPTTVVGFAAGGLALATGGRVQVRRGVVEFHGGFWRWYFARTGFAAMTLGHAIIGRDPVCLDWARDHEHVHVRQVERWGGLFLPAYLLASLWAWTQGRDPYRGNVFEIEAYDDDDRRSSIARKGQSKRPQS